MLKKIRILIALCLVVNSVKAQMTNVNISNGVVFDAEPYMAMNPVNHHNIVVAWMGYSNYKITIKLRSTFDGGVTWSNAILLPHQGVTWHSADVSMAFDKNGLLYLTYIDYRQSPDSGGVYIIHSKDGGLTWSTPSRVWNVNETTKKAMDRPWLAIDGKGNLFVTTKPAPWIPAPNRPYLKYSTDSGKTWSSYKYVDTTNYRVGGAIQAPMAALAVSANGRLNMVYPSYLISQSVYPQFFLATTFDKGLNLKYHTVHTGMIGLGDTLYKAGYRLCCHPIDTNKMAVVFPGKINKDADIYVLSSNDAGVTWNSTPVRVNDDSVNNGKWQDMVWANYDSTGNLWVTWRDRRLSSGSGFINQGVDFYGAVSTDNGATFHKNIRLSDTTAQYDSILKKNGNDFMCNALYGDTAYSVWGDTRNGRLQVYFVKTSLANALSVKQVLASEEGISYKIVPDYNGQTIKIMCLTGFDENASVKVMDINGRIITSKHLVANANLFSLSMPAVASGIYIVEILSGEESTTKKIYWGQ